MDVLAGGSQPARRAETLRTPQLAVGQSDSRHFPATNQRSNVSLDTAAIHARVDALILVRLRPSNRPESASSRYQSDSAPTVSPPFFAAFSSTGARIVDPTNRHLAAMRCQCRIERRRVSLTFADGVMAAWVGQGVGTPARVRFPPLTVNSEAHWLLAVMEIELADNASCFRWGAQGNCLLE